MKTDSRKGQIAKQDKPNCRIIISQITEKFLAEVPFAVVHDAEKAIDRTQNGIYAISVECLKDEYRTPQG